MIKLVCDACGNETTRNCVSNRIVTHKMTHHGFGVEILVKRHSTWNLGELCAACLATTVALAFQEAEHG